MSEGNLEEETAATERSEVVVRMRATDGRYLALLTSITLCSCKRP